MSTNNLLLPTQSSHAQESSLPSPPSSDIADGVPDGEFSDHNFLDGELDDEIPNHDYPANGPADAQDAIGAILDWQHKYLSTDNTTIVRLLVRWGGTPTEYTWKPESDLVKDVPDFVERFWKGRGSRRQELVRGGEDRIPFKTLGWRYTHRGDGGDRVIMFFVHLWVQTSETREEAAERMRKLAPDLGP